MSSYRIKSDHSGIEITEAVTAFREGTTIKSDHSGIEIIECILRRVCIL